MYICRVTCLRVGLRANRGRWGLYIYREREETDRQKVTSQTGTAAESTVADAASLVCKPSPDPHIHIFTHTHTQRERGCLMELYKRHTENRQRKK